MGVVSHSQEPAGNLAPNHKTDEDDDDDDDDYDDDDYNDDDDDDGPQSQSR